MINYVLGVVRKQFLIHLYIQHDTIDACAVLCRVTLASSRAKLTKRVAKKTPGSCAADAVNITPGRDSGDQGDNNLRFGVVTSYNALVVT